LLHILDGLVQVGLKGFAKILLFIKDHDNKITNINIQKSCLNI
jgi:hypothetical protein